MREFLAKLFIPRILNRKGTAQVGPLIGKEKPTYSQPDYSHLWNAYVAGAKAARKHPQATHIEKTQML